MKSIWVPLSGQIAQQQKIETIANNVANVNTAGFKKDSLAFKEYLTALDKGLDDIDLPQKEWSPDDFYKTQGAQNSFVTVNGSYTIFEQGQLMPTGNPLDLAIRGKGFFEVNTPQGIRFTRNGSFTLSSEGVLVTNQGHQVLKALERNGDNNEIPIESRFINLNGAQKVSIANDGAVYLNDEKISALSIVEFNDMQSLKKEGSGLFINHNKNILTESKNSTIHQGFIEGSNVNAISEMSELIKAHRHFENIQKAVKVYDSITGNAANDIAKF